MPLRSKKVMIVDDEVRMADSLRDLLADAGYMIETAYSGVEAVEKLRRNSFHVVVTDLRMQDLDGLDLIHYIHDTAPMTLVIVITGHASTESAIEAVHYHVFDYLRKPFDFDLLRMAIEKAFHKLEAEQLRQDTAAMLTHDIKIPLTSIIGFASMIFDVERDAFHPRAREFADTIRSNGQKILELIENYLTSHKIESGTLRALIEPVDLRQTVHDVIEAESIEAQRRNFCIEVETNDLPDSVCVDEVLIYRALSNLLRNAIKYHFGADPIRIEGRTVPAADSPLGTDSVELAVTNHCLDALPEDFNELFHRYQRGRFQKSIEGSGIGLYVVHAVAEAHKGQVQGALVGEEIVRFSLCLPLNLKDQSAR